MARAVAGLIALACPLGMAEALPDYTITVGASPGGGYDLTARAIGSALQEAGLAGQVTYHHKGGAGGTLALSEFVLGHAGRPNALIVAGAVMVGATVQSRPPRTLLDAVPIARLASEYNVLVTAVDSPMRNLRDVLDQMRRDPRSVRWGGGSRGSVDQISVALIAKSAGVPPSRVVYLPFKGGGEAAAAVIGRQITIGISGVAEFEAQIHSGRLRALAVTSGARLEGIDAPTLKELGLDVEIGNWRGLYAAPGITAEQRDRIVNAVVLATRTPGWQRMLKEYRWSDALLVGDSFARFVDDEHTRLKRLMADSGLL